MMLGWRALSAAVEAVEVVDIGVVAAEGDAAVAGGEVIEGVV